MMTLWWAAFFVLGVAAPPTVPFEWISFLVAAALAAAMLSRCDADRPAPATRDAHGRGAAVASCVMTVATGLILWQGAGLERRSFDVGGPGAGARASLQSASQRVSRTGHAGGRVREDAPSVTAGALGRLRRHLIESLDDGRLDRTGKGIVGALVLDHRTDLGFDLRETYSYLGITHFLALSGMHLGVIAVPLAWICGLVVRSRRGRDILLFSILCLYAGVAAFPASLLRALAMSAAVIVYRILGLRPGLLVALIGGCLALVVFDSSVTFDAGFQLSFAAVCAIALIGIPLSRIVEAFLPGGFGGIVLRALVFPALITCSVQFLTMPLTVALFNRASLISPIVNVMVSLPFTALLYLGVAYVFVPVGALRTVLCLPINLICRFLDVVPSAFSHSPHAAVYRGDFDLALYLAGVGCAAYALRRCARARLHICFVGAFLVAVSFMARSGPSVDPTIGVSLNRKVTEVGESKRGGVHVARGGGVLVVDEGFSRGEGYRLTKELWGEGVREIELCIVVPARPRRTAGLLYLATRISLCEVICSRYLSLADRRLEEALRGTGAMVRLVAAGDTIVTPSFTVCVLSPRFPPERGTSVPADSLRVQCRVIERPRLTSKAPVHTMLKVR